MTMNRREKDENRAYAAEHGISYTAAKRILDAQRAERKAQPEERSELDGAHSS